MGSRRALAGHNTDNVAITVEEVSTGDKVIIEGKAKKQAIEAIETVPFGFKIALDSLSKGSKIVRYGEVIGEAIVDIKKGAQVHIHNIDGIRVQVKEGKK